MGASTDILDAVVARLATINGAGSFVKDLSGGEVADQIWFGSTLQPPNLAADSVCIYDLQEPADDGVALGRRERRLLVELRGFVRSAADAPKSRIYASCDLKDDLITAFTGSAADRTLGGLVRDTTLEATAFDGMEWGLDGFGAVHAILTIRWVS